HGSLYSVEVDADAGGFAAQLEAQAAVGIEHACADGGLVLRGPVVEERRGGDLLDRVQAAIGLIGEEAELGLVLPPPEVAPDSLSGTTISGRRGVGLAQCAAGVEDTGTVDGEDRA